MFAFYIILILVVIYYIAIYNKQKEKEAQELKLKQEKEIQELQLKREQQRKKAEQEFQIQLNAIEDIKIDLNPEPIKRNRVKDFPLIKFSTITSRTIKDRISDFVVIDLETTGLSAGKNEIIEISAIRFSNFEPIEKMSSLIKPKHEIPSEITDINKITNEDVKSSPTISEVIPSFIDFIGNSNLVGHNLIFDLKFLHANGFNIFESKRKYFDTLELSRKTLKDLYNYKLDTVADNYSIIIPNQHRAEHDALATGLIFGELVDELI